MAGSTARRATANPALNEDVYRRAGLADTPAQIMTVQGTVLKTATLVLLLVTAGAIDGTHEAEPVNHRASWLHPAEAGG